MGPVDKQKDLELWRTWKRTRSTSDLEALVRQIKPLIDSEVLKWSSVGAKFVLENRAKQIVIAAFDTFDPNRGVLLSTYLKNELRKLSRDAYERQSILKVPEDHRITYNQFTKARAELEDRHGRVPSIERIADHMGLPVSRIEAVINTVEKRTLMESGEGPTFQQNNDDADDSEMLEFAYHQMSPRQKQIYDMRTGSHGRTEARSDQEIMRAVNVTQGVLSYELGKIKELLKKAGGKT